MKLPFALLIITGSVAAGNPLSVSLLSEVDSITPGEPFAVGITLKPPAGFHTYWKYPGIVGVATSVEWSLPPGFSAGEIQWPAPEAVKMARYTAQGYRGECLLMIPITPPPVLPNTPVQLKVRVSGMCCGDQCHPANRIPVSISLPVSKQSLASPSTQPLFARFRERIPRKCDLWQSEVTRQGGTLTLSLTSRNPLRTRDVADLGAIRVFTGNSLVDSNAPQVLTRGPGQRVQIDLCISDMAPPDQKLAAVVVAEQSWMIDDHFMALEIP